MKHINFPGFSILELVIGLMISTMLITISFSIYNQIVRSTQFVQRVTTTDIHAIILKDRLQNDILGIMPLWFTKKDYEESAKAKTSTQPKESEHEEQPESKENKQETSKNKENNFFYSSNHTTHNTFDCFSFITTNPLHMYGSSEHKPCVRVVYRLQNDTTHESQFRLFRKEIDDLEFNLEAIHNSGALYEIASNIKTFSIEFGFIDPIKTSNQTEKKEAAPLQDKSIEFTWINEWDAKKESTIKKPILPKFIKIKIVFTEEKSTHEQEYNFCFLVPLDTIAPYATFSQRRKPVEKDPDTSSGPSNSNNITGDKGDKNDKNNNDNTQEQAKSTTPQAPSLTQNDQSPLAKENTVIAGAKHA